MMAYGKTGNGKKMEPGNKMETETGNGNRNGNGNRLMSSVLHHYSSTVDREIFAIKIFRLYA